MSIALEELTARSTCAIYNDLSHINPRYLTPQNYERTFHDEEVLYHKKNLILLSLYFDKIIICTDNLLAFTRFLSKDIVSSVVMSPWFLDLVEQGIIVLAGWGSSMSTDMMRNQAEYSLIYRPELKEQKYVDFLFSLSRDASWAVREPGPGEREHINFLRPLVLSSEGPFEARDIEFLSDLIDQTNDTVGYVGTMEIFPFIDDLYRGNSSKADSFYNSYYASWHSYCAQHYAPAIPIHTSRIRLPVTRIMVAPGQPPILATLYSPDLFQKYLVRRFGAKLFSQILDVDVKRLAAIRNGDWARFKKRYHEYLSAASRISWIMFHPKAHELLTDERVIDALLAEIFKSAHGDADLSALGGVLDLVLRLATGFSFVAPAFALFRKQINERLGRFSDSVVQRELEPYLRKLRGVLEKPMSALVTA
jgi:hypothetical protein